MTGIDTDTPQNPLKWRLTAIGASFLVSIVLMAVKFHVYRMTGSSAVLSDALESIINVVASAFALASVVMSAMPPDENHPYGHGKIEFFSAGFEGALIVLAALGIFTTAIPQLAAPHRIPRLEGGLVILTATAAVNLLTGLSLVWTGKRTVSLALIADGKHLITDVYTSAGVVIGLFCVHLTGWYWMDGLIACLVGLNIVVVGVKLVYVAFHGLMDASDPRLLKEVATLLEAHRQPNWIDVHRLRATRSGSRVNIDFHLILPSYLSLQRAHDESKKLEKHLIDHFREEVHVLIHLDPCSDPDCPVCRNDDCQARTRPLEAPEGWDLDSMRRFSTGRGPGGGTGESE